MRRATILIAAARKLVRMSIDALGAPFQGDESLERILDSSLFDAGYYRAQLDPPERAGSDLDIAAHFHVDGWRNLRDPSPRFSTADYLLTNADVAAAGIDPLMHYLQYGRSEGRTIAPAPAKPTKPVHRAMASAPGDDDWQNLAARCRSTAAAVPEVDVIVPVFKGVAETLRCLYGVLAVTPLTPFRLVVVDDHSPEAAIVARLKWLARRDLIDLVRTTQNAGFVRACNLGIGLHPERDVVLLNSDTEVFGDWLERLRAAARRDATIGTVTPFSNNAEICSYPYLCRDNPFLLEVSDADLDALAARANAGGSLDLPTGVGFCLYVRRACLAEIGALDVETFGAGYGEENDFCRRAAAAGWRNVLAADVFVRHYGGSSFGASKVARIEAAIAAVEGKHPGYLDEIARFIDADPVAPWRARLDAARMLRRFAGRPAMLFVGHTRGGGTERHMREMAALLETFDRPVLFARPDKQSAHLLRIGDPQLRFQPNAVTFDLTDDPARFAAGLATLGIAHVHVHHLVGFADGAADYLRLGCAAAGIAYDFTVHDYLAICPRITLTDDEGWYCGEPDGDGCQDCLRRRGSEFGTPAIWDWRQRYGRFLQDARHVYVPADDVGRRLARHYPSVAFTTRPHLCDRRAPSRRRNDGRGDTGLRHVGLVGALGPHKGAPLLLRCAMRAAERDLPIRFTLVGYTDRDDAFRDCRNVTIEGAYIDAELGGRVAALAPDLLWFSALWPETYSYTLSAAFDAGVLPVAFDFGAIAERIRRTGFGHLLPIDLMFDADRTLDALLAIDPRGGLAAPPDELVTYRAPLQSYYGLPATRGLPRPAESVA